MKGMDFFKKMGQKGSSSLFGGMKVKGPTASEKPKVAQTQTHLGSTVSEASRLSQAPQKLIPTSQKFPEKQTIKDVEKKLPVAQDEEDTQQINDEPQSKFELPPIEKPKPEKSQPSETKTKSQSKRSSQENESQHNGSIQNNSKLVSPELTDHKSVSESVRKNSEKKESVSESNYAFDKKKNRDRKQSNPFLNQIKKNTTMPRQNQHQYDLDDTPKATSLGSQLKLPKKTEKQSVLEQINNSHIKSIQFILRQKQMKQSIIQIASNLQQNRDELTQSTQKQCQCVEKEDYDQAENYQNKIENLQKKIEEQEVQLQKRQTEYYKSEYDQLKQDKQQHYESKKIVRQIKLAQLQLLEESSNLKRKKAEFQQNQNVKIDNQNKKITRLHNDIKFQSEQIAQFQKKYKQDLNSRKDPLTTQLNQSQALKTKLEEQIEELEKKLKQKRESLKQLTIKVTTIKKEIKGVDQNFKQQGIKLQQRKKKLQSLQNEKKNLVQNLKVLQKSKTTEAEAISKKSEELQKQAKNLTEMGSEIEAKEVSYQDKIEDRKVKVDTFIHNTNLLKEFQSKHKQKRMKVKELDFKKANVAAQANSLQEKRTATKQRIPKLEAEQKSLAEAKNFKAANMKKTQIKQAQQQIELMSKKIEECFTKQKEIEQQITKLRNQEMDHVGEENQIRKNLAISQFKFDVCKWEQLKAELIWVEKFNGREDLQKKYRGILAEHLQALVEEIRYIGQQYGLSLEFLTQTQQIGIAPQQKKEIKQKIVDEPAKITNSSSADIVEQQNEDETNNHEKHKDKPSQEKEQAKIEQKEQQQDQQEEQQERKEEVVQVQAQLNHGDTIDDGDDDGGYVPLQLD